MNRDIEVEFHPPEAIIVKTKPVVWEFEVGICEKVLDNRVSVAVAMEVDRTVVLIRRVLVRVKWISEIEVSTGMMVTTLVIITASVFTVEGVAPTHTVVLLST